MKKQNLGIVLEQLPSNIIESELSLAAQKTLGALLLWTENSKAMESGIIAIDNELLCKIGGVGHTTLQNALAELKLYGLVDRKVGTCLGNASEYDINFEALELPIRKRSIGERFARFKDKAQSLETPIGTPLHNISLHNNTLHSITDHNKPYHNSTEHNNSEHNSTEQTKPTHNTTEHSTSNQAIADQNTTEHYKSEQQARVIEDKVIDSLFGGCVLDPKDYEEDNSFLEDLNKRIAYARREREESED